ncbi:MAG: hypothetical protein AB2L20_12250 [Mangrovibacterium sp.]
MEIKELIKKAHEACSKYISVGKVSFETYIDFEKNVESMELTIFYFDSSLSKRTNFSVIIWSHNSAYSIELLMKELEKELIKFAPFKTTSLSIQDE